MAIDNKCFIAQRVAKELNDGDVVNLGIGLPTLVANYIPEGIVVYFHAEVGIIGAGPDASPDKENKDCFDASGKYITVLPGSAYVDSATSFAIIRGGHLDATVLGALQVDEKGNLASWMVPGKKVPGMGGAMDLVTGAKKVIVAMEHTNKGNPKILKQCTFPLTGIKVVDMIITEMGVMEITQEGIILREIAPNVTLDEIRAVTEADIIVKPDLKFM
jgi:acetate CoA/acetoacetate CoA-transferase beta subunit